MITLLFWLFAAHFIGDFVLQSDTMGREKFRSSETELQKIVPWYYWLTAHAFTHGALIAFVTGSTLLGILETIAHGIIDFGKTEGWYGLCVDQLLHILCKVMWFSIILSYA